jgi:putative DNA primase/helicase
MARRDDGGRGTVNSAERARGRWLEILPLLGISRDFLQNRHGPCPCCGGKDRWRFDDLDGDGTYYCNQCGPGNGLSLIQKFKDWTFAEACAEIDKIVGLETRRPFTRRYVRPRPTDDQRQEALQRLLGEATEPLVVEDYLARRGLRDLGAAIPAVLKGHPRCPYWDDRTQQVREYPAVLAPIIGPNDKLVSVQRIYDGPVSPRKMTMPAVGTINKAAVRLYPAEEDLGITEGVENGIAVYLMYGIPTWAALSANGVQVFEPPAEVTTLHIFADNDANFVGQAAATHLASRLSRGKGAIQVKVNIPPEAGVDWLDLWNERQT